MEVYQTYQHLEQSPYDYNIDVRARNFSWLILGAIAGSVSMYLMDPQRGRSRRARVHQKTIGIGHDLAFYSDKQVRNFGNHVWGLGAQVLSYFFKNPITDDATLVQRVRSKIGRQLTHPRAIHVRSEKGRVFLSGHILSTEVERVVECVKRIPGVQHVVNDLEVHTKPGNIPDLQGQGKPYLNENRT